MTKVVGILALQGSYSLHQEKIENLGAQTLDVKCLEDLEKVSALIIPGGESTTFLKLLNPDFRKALQEKILSGLPTLATCAGVILLARKVSNPSQDSLKLLNIEIERNSYGRQKESFIEPKLLWQHKIKNNLPSHIEGVFIRAPKIKHYGKEVEVLIYREDEPVLIKSGNILAATFHPELSSGASTVHSLLLEL